MNLSLIGIDLPFKNALILDSRIESVILLGFFTMIELKLIALNLI